MATTTVDSSPSGAMPFVDRRKSASGSTPGVERRQFANSYNELPEDAAELARAVDSYKARHRRRFINFDELLGVVKSLGYDR